MRFPILKTYLTITVLFVLCKELQAQDSTRVQAKDTLADNSIKVSPYFSYNVGNSGAYLKRIDDRKLLKLSSGVSSFNALRGNVPGLTIPADFASAHFSGMRTGSSQFINDALVVIDGIPTNNYIGNYINLNTFDFSSITSFSNTNSLSFLGGANSGVFVLNTKNGEGITKPLIEFNSFVTQGSREIPGTQISPSTKYTEWFVNNAISFSQDFGVVDTRISYTLQKQPDVMEGPPYYHNLKINTGFDVGERLDIRLVVDGRLAKEKESFQEEFPLTGNGERNLGRKLFSANLLVRYELLNWLGVSAQGLMSTHESTSKFSGSNTKVERDIDYSRTYASIYLDVKKQVLNAFNISGFFGISDSKQNINDYRLSLTPIFGLVTADDSWELNEQNLVGHASFSYHNILHLSGHWKSGDYGDLNKKEGSSSATSGSFAFIFSELLPKSFMSLGKLRASAGTHQVIPFLTYPVLDNEDQSDYVLPEQKTRPYDVNNLESGLDVGFFDSRLLFTFNYFQNVETYQLPANAYQPITKYFNKGWEVELRYWPVRKKNFSFETAILLSNTNSKYERLNASPSEGKPFLVTRWFNYATYKSLTATLLFEAVDNYTGYASNTGNEDVSFTKLREVSLGFNLPPSWFVNSFINGGSFSLTGRNLIVLGGSDRDYELEFTRSLFQKSVSGSLSLTF